MNGKKTLSILFGALALVLAVGLVAWAFGPDAWREEAVARLGLLPVPPQRPPSTVQVAPARTTTVAVSAESVGTLHARETVTIGAEVNGHIAVIHFDEGERVDVGDLLVELVADEEHARLASAEAFLKEARLDLQRAQELPTGQAIAAADVDRLQAAYDAALAERDLARALLKKHRLRAPFGGRIGLREVSPGALVSPDTAIVKLYAIDPMELRFALSERLVDRVRKGLNVIASSTAFPDERFVGTISQIAPGIDPDTRQITVEAELPNAEGRLRPGQFMNVEVVLGRRSDAVVIPEEALLRRGNASYVYVVGDDNKVARREVRTGISRQDSIEIRAGLAAGERVVIGGIQKVTDGETVKIVGATRDASGSGGPGVQQGAPE